MRRQLRRVRWSILHRLHGVLGQRSVLSARAVRERVVCCKLFIRRICRRRRRVHGVLLQLCDVRWITCEQLHIVPTRQRHEQRHVCELLHRLAVLLGRPAMRAMRRVMRVMLRTWTRQLHIVRCRIGAVRRYLLGNMSIEVVRRWTGLM